MTRKIWISSVLALTAAMLVLAPTTALAGSPLLSGYGGPGAGEQAILGSTLVGGSGGGAGGSSGSGGSGGANLSGSAGALTSSAGGTSSTGSGSARGSGVGAANVGSGSRGTSKGGGAARGLQGGRSTGVGGAASAYVYSTSQGSIASASPLTSMSSGGVLLLIGILATLALVAVLTLRLSRLQS